MRKYFTSVYRNEPKKIAKNIFHEILAYHCTGSYSFLCVFGIRGKIWATIYNEKCFYMWFNITEWDWVMIIAFQCWLLLFNSRICWKSYQINNLEFHQPMYFSRDLKILSENSVGWNSCTYSTELLQWRLVVASLSLVKNSRNIK